MKKILQLIVFALAFTACAEIEPQNNSAEKADQPSALMPDLSKVDYSKSCYANPKFDVVLDFVASEGAFRIDIVDVLSKKTISSIGAQPKDGFTPEYTMALVVDDMPNGTAAKEGQAFDGNIAAILDADSTALDEYEEGSVTYIIEGRVTYVEDQAVRHSAAIAPWLASLTKTNGIITIKIGQITK